MPKLRSSPRRAFTFVELLVVISIITVLLAILMPAIAKAREHARRAQCLGNIRALTSAWIDYAITNESLVSANTGGIPDWVQSGNTDANMRNGLLYPYVGSVGPYRCPSDSNLTNDRTYSISSVLNGTYANPVTYYRLTQIKNPSSTFVFIEEFDYRGYNENSWAVPWGPTQWVDRPAHLHHDGCTISFVDGHALYWQFSDQRTINIDFNATTPNNVDLAYIISVQGY
ncbi:MAG TPA: prepilin-type N-terminal cleavage/methylation domain-containing protein [Tepidisphaeraceae bacterium]|jgi:prepilin-type N-terminal cleavage/methylation domain-containing protein|nr:prepilin-type N-terminal cleavage/methylation domain-containing protein [Tepidisphaeraceae bacterium]